MRNHRVSSLFLLVLSATAFAQPSSREKAIVRDRPAANRFEAGKKWALLIGVNDYADPGITDLRYCVADAKRVAATLTEHCGYPAENILIYTDDQVKAHMHPNKFLPGGVADWLEIARPGDTVLVFFSGHGFLDEEKRGFLALQDTELDNLSNTSLAAQHLRDMLHRCQASQKILVLDCCHAATERGGPSTGPSSEEIGRAFDNAKGLITLASCGKEEFSLEWPDKGQGLFTHHLDQGMRGAADANGDGYVTSGELYEYTFAQVRAAAQRVFGRKQQPRQIRGPDVIGTFALARCRVVPRMQELPSPPPTTRAPGALNTITNSIGMKLVLIGPQEVMMGPADWDKDADSREHRRPRGKIALVAPAEFLMGSPNSAQWSHSSEQPQHRVRITNPFYVGATEVTQGQYEQVMGENPSRYKGDPQWPVESVCWEDAVEFCRRLSKKEDRTYRLPTEAEWEYVCRAGSTTTWCFGDSESQLDEYAWFRDNSKVGRRGRTHPVGQKKPNAWGLYDMHGNVQEWCSDWYGKEYYYTQAAGTDPQGPDSGEYRIFRGGDYSSGAKDTRSAVRKYEVPVATFYDLGFRVVLVPAG